MREAPHLNPRADGTRPHAWGRGWGEPGGSPACSPRRMRGGRVTRLLVIGPEPPPLTGMEVATRTLVDELRRAGVPVVRVDTADRGDDLGNRARWTPHNVT